MKRILVAEDNPANRELIRTILELRGCEVLEAGDGEEALLKIREIRPDLVLMDVQMPRLGGLAALQEMRADPGLAPIPVIALTAYAMQGDQERFLAAGFDGYASKPIDAKALWRQMEPLLGRENVGRHGPS